MNATKVVKNNIKPVAQAGLIAKGITYCLLGLLTIMAAFNINGQSAEDTDKSGVFDFIYRQTGGQILLGILALGLICYCIWRFVLVFEKTDDDTKKGKAYAKKARYLFSAFAYASIAYSVIRRLIYSVSDSSGDSKESLARELLSKPAGQWLVGIAAAIFLGVGVYQIYYGFSEKYKKHVDKSVGNDKGRKAVLTAGKTGYIARGVVWLLLAFLFFKAAYNANSSSAGNTSKAFGFLEDQSYGSFLLAAVGLGLVCYGTFSFVRARYEDLG